ncbi:hypothetical protein LCGC14_2676780 [marine sediment metagenome]|uniref:Uncharacterized protein n=1 Tax=marine sediment metagenome TaxID=412755 RepID=A0A0F8ZMJ6_9ZZZZ
MKIRIFILSFILLVGGMGCPATIPIIGTLGTIGMATNKFINYKLTKRGLDLKEREIALKEKIFEKGNK